MKLKHQVISINKSLLYFNINFQTYFRFHLIDCEDGSDAGQAVDVVGAVERVEADDEVSLLLGLNLNNVVHLFRN